MSGRMEMHTKCADLNRLGRELRLAKDPIPNREESWFRLRRFRLDIAIFMSMFIAINKDLK